MILSITSSTKTTDKKHVLMQHEHTCTSEETEKTIKMQQIDVYY